MSAPLHDSRILTYTKVKTKIGIPYHSNRKLHLETGAGPWFYPRRGISKQEFRRPSPNGIFDCSRQWSNTECWYVAARLPSNPYRERRGRRGTIRGATLMYTKVPLRTAQYDNQNHRHLAPRLQKE